MSKAADTQQANRHIRAGEQADHARANHQNRTHGHYHFTGDDQVHAKPALEQRRQVTPNDTAEVCEQHRHPGEHGDLFQVKAVDFKHEQRDPGVEGTPGWLCQETWQRDAPELAGTQNLPDGHLLTVVGLVLCFLTANDVFTFFFRQLLLIARVFVENQPGHRPGEAQHAGDNEGQLPAVHDDCPYHQRRCNHRPDRGADVEVAYGDRTLFCREPLGGGFQACRDHRSFSGTYCTTGQR